MRDRSTLNNTNIYKRALKLAVPMMIQGGIANAVVLVDNLMVGSLGTESISGVSIAGHLLMLYNLAIFGGLSGPGIYGSQFFGHGDKKGFAQVFRLKLFIALTITFLAVLIFFFRGRFLVGLFFTGDGGSFDPSLALDKSMDYMMIMLIGLLPFSLNQVYATSFREMNRSLEPMVCGILSVVVDIILNYILIFGKLGFPRMGVRGAAAATVIARTVEFSAIVLRRRLKADLYPYLKDVYGTLSIPVARLKVILRKSFPIFANEFLWAGGVVTLTQCYSVRGLSVVAAMNISNVLCNLLAIVFVNLGESIGIIEGQFLGASEFQKAKESAHKLIWFSCGICVGLAVILIGLSGIFPMAYNTAPEVRHLASWFIIITAAFFPLQGLLNSMYFTIRSGGKTLVTFIFDSVFSWCVSVPLAYLLSHFTSLPILPMIAIVQGADAIKVIVGFYLLKRGVWISNLVSGT